MKLRSPSLLLFPGVTTDPFYAISSDLALTFLSCSSSPSSFPHLVDQEQGRLFRVTPGQPRASIKADGSNVASGLIGLESN